MEKFSLFTITPLAILRAALLPLFEGTVPLLICYCFDYAAAVGQFAHLACYRRLG